MFIWTCSERPPAFYGHFIRWSSTVHARSWKKCRTIRHPSISQSPVALVWKNFIVRASQCKVLNDVSGQASVKGLSLSQVSSALGVTVKPLYYGHFSITTNPSYFHFQVGWSQKKLIVVLKENQKEVTLTLKKRPRHTNPLGGHGHKNKKKPKNLQQSTFPKALSRRSRESEKGARPPLKDFLSALPPSPSESLSERLVLCFISLLRIQNITTSPEFVKHQLSSRSGDALILRSHTSTFHGLAFVTLYILMWNHSSAICIWMQDGNSLTELRVTVSVEPEANNGSMGR